jgi:uncharacterized membrane protein YdjX (TVP38/TMEM64 family)
VLRLAACGVLLVMAVSGLAAVRLWPREMSAGLDAAVRITRGLGAASWLVAAGAQVLIALCGILPASIGALTAGMLYGIVPGFVLSAVGTLVGAALAFMATRSLLRPWVAQALARWPRIDRLDEAVARDGWRLVCLLRVSPVMPLAVTSYARGLTSLRFRAYLIGTLAALPVLLGYVVLGHLAGASLGALSAPGVRPVRWALLLAAIIGTGFLTLRLGRMVARVIR